jgi:hypothetical protein
MITSPAQDDGRQQFIVADTLGLLIVVVVCAASVQERDGARQALLGMYFAFPVRFVFADGGFRRTTVGLGHPHPAHDGRDCA